jgi:hypothetical protein
MGKDINCASVNPVWAAELPNRALDSAAAASASSSSAAAASTQVSQMSVNVTSDQVYCPADDDENSFFR